jgi:hypothetical protein
MSMTIWTEDGHERSWHIGERFPYLAAPIAKITADCDELDHVLSFFANLPYPKRMRVVTWRNPWAQFIFDNAQSPTEHSSTWNHSLPETTKGSG